MDLTTFIQLKGIDSEIDNNLIFLNLTKEWFFLMGELLNVVNPHFPGYTPKGKLS
jgi:hypothetical protein